MSVRRAIQRAIAEACSALDLDEVYGVIESKEKRYRAVTFCRAAILDGEVRIYGENFILVRWETAIREFPRRGTKKFGTVGGAISFLVGFADSTKQHKPERN